MRPASYEVLGGERMNKKSLSLILAAVMLAAVVPAVTIPGAAAAQTPISFRLIWGVTGIDFQGFNTSDFGAWYYSVDNLINNSSMPGSAAYRNLLDLGAPISVYSNGAMSITKVFNGSIIVANVTMPNGTVVNLTQGNIIVVNGQQMLRNFTIYVPIKGDPTIIQKIDASVFVYGYPGVAYNTTSGYQEYTDGSAMAAVRVNLRKPIPLSEINYAVVVVKVAYIDGSGKTRFMMNPVVIVPDKKAPTVGIDTFEFNQTDEPLAHPGWYVIHDPHAVAYFNDNGPLDMNVTFSDDIGVHDLTVEIYAENGTLLGETQVFINNTRESLSLLDTPLPNDIAKGIPPEALLWDTITKNELYLYNSDYLLKALITGTHAPLNTSDIITKYITPTALLIVPVNVSGTDQKFMMRFEISPNGVLNSNQIYKIVVKSEDTLGRTGKAVLYIGDNKAPQVTIGAPAPGSIYNAKGWDGIKTFVTITDPDTTTNVSSNITYFKISLFNADLGTQVDLSRYAGSINIPPEFNWNFVNGSIVAYVNYRDLAPKVVPDTGYPLYFTIYYLTHDMPDGKYVLQVTAEDRAGNVNTSKTWFIVDTVAPRITSVTVNGQTYSNKNIQVNVSPYVELSWNATDKIPGYPDITTSGIVAYYVTVTQSGNTIGTYTLSTPHLTLKLAPGVYDVQIYAKDAAGNMVDPSQRVNVLMNITPGHGLSQFITLAKTLNGMFVTSPTATADSYAAMIFAAPTTGPLPVRYSTDVNLSQLNSSDYIISIGGPAVNSITAHYQNLNISPVKMEIVNGKVQIVTPNETFTWVGPHGKWWNVTSGYFVIQMVKDPTTGATVFMIYGTDRDSTAAGAYWLYEQFATGNITKFDGVYWVVGQWTDTDHKVSFDFLKGSPDDHNGFSYGDSIQIVAEG